MGFRTPFTMGGSRAWYNTATRGMRLWLRRLKSTRVSCMRSVFNEHDVTDSQAVDMIFRNSGLDLGTCEIVNCDHLSVDKSSWLFLTVGDKLVVSR